MLKRFWKLNTPPPAGAAITGVTNWVSPTLVTSGANASFGAVAGLFVEVTHGTSIPVAAVVHPAGSVGATTPSKFCVNVALHGEAVGVADGVPVAVAVAVAGGVNVAVAVGVGDGVDGVGVGVGGDTPVIVMRPLV